MYNDNSPEVHNFSLEVFPMSTLFIVPSVSPLFFLCLLPLWCPRLSSSSWVRWRWMGRLSRCVSRSTVRCSPRPWRLPWTAWTPWTPCLCQDASECEATAMWGRSTRAVLGRRKEKEGDLCSCCHPLHHAHLPPPSGPSRAAQVGDYKARMDVQSEYVFFFPLPFLCIICLPKLCAKWRNNI